MKRRLLFRTLHTAVCPAGLRQDADECVKMVRHEAVCKNCNVVSHTGLHKMQSHKCNDLRLEKKWLAMIRAEREEESLLAHIA